MFLPWVTVRERNGGMAPFHHSLGLLESEGRLADGTWPRGLAQRDVDVSTGPTGRRPKIGPSGERAAVDG
ncbi:hypothetical protein [Cellulomonas sp.]